MIIKESVPVYKYCWLNHCSGGTISKIYEPETKIELVSLVRSLYKEDKCYEIVGYTSNIYYMPDYNPEIIISTRRLNKVDVFDSYIYAECGTSVRKLSRTMLSNSVAGFEGLIDLPGTVAASVYGNASCYNCSINKLLIDCEVLFPNGIVKNLNQDDLKLQHRSSIFKRREIEGVILSVRLRKEHGDYMTLKKQAEVYKKDRLATQPGPVDNLGSIYSHPGDFSKIGFIIKCISKILFYFVRVVRSNISSDIIMLYILGAKDIIPYVYNWNRYIWKDEESHKLFWKFHKIHKLIFENSDFEIEIKCNSIYG